MRRIASVCLAIVAVLLASRLVGKGWRTRPGGEGLQYQRIAISRDKESDGSLDSPDPAMPRVPLIAESSGLPEAEQGEKYLIRVEGYYGHPIEGARVVSADVMEIITRIGLTDEDGMSSSSVPGGRVYLSAEKEGYACQTVLVEPSANVTVSIALPQERKLCGYVFGPDGSPARVGAMVIAYSAAMRLPPRDMLGRALAGDPRFHLTRTDGQGHFCMPGLDESMAYCLAAGCDQGVSDTLLVSALSAGNAVELRLRPVLVAFLHVLEEGGNDLRLPDVFDPGIETSCHWSGVGRAPEALPQWAVMFIGIDRGAQASGPLDMMLLYFGNVGASSVGPLVYDINVPGYRPVEYRFRATRLSDGLNELRVELLPTVVERGELSVRVEGCAGGMVPGRLRQPPVVLTIWGTAGLSFNLAMNDLEPGTAHVTSLPVGSYVGRFRTLLGAVSEEYPFTIVVGVTAEVVYVKRGGAIKVEMRRADRREVYCEDVVLVVGSMGGSIRGEFDFARGPYVVEGLPSGLYWIGVRYPLSAEGVLGIAVVDGEVAEASLLLKDRS